RTGRGRLVFLAGERGAPSASLGVLHHALGNLRPASLLLSGALRDGKYVPDAPPPSGPKTDVFNLLLTAGSRTGSLVHPALGLIGQLIQALLAIDKEGALGHKVPDIDSPTALPRYLRIAADTQARKRGGLVVCFIDGLSHARDWVEIVGH